MKSLVSRALVPWPVWLTLFAVLVATAALIVWRSTEFAALEPRQDHAWFTQWVRAFHEAARFWPLRSDGESWQAALEADGDSALHVVLRQLYAVPFAMLDLGAFGAYGLLGLVVGVSMPAQVAISVIFASLTIAATTLFAFWLGWRHGSCAEALLLAFATLAFCAASSFLRVFSALGPHNAAVLMLVLLVWVTERWLALETARATGFRGGENAAGPGQAARGAVLALYGVTIFTYHGGTVLAPLVLGLAILLAPRLGLGRRLWLLAELMGWTLLLLLPLAAAAWIASGAAYMGSQDQSIVTYIRLALGEGDNIARAVATPLLERVRLWFDAQAALFSQGGLALGLAGLAGIAVRHGRRLPLIVALVHLGCGVLIPSFTQYDRTSAYLVPFLCLGAAWSVAVPAAALLAGRRLAAIALAVALLLVLAHGRTEWPRLCEPEQVAGWQHYLRQQGDWRLTQREIERLVPASAVLIPWDYQLRHLYSSFRQGGPRLYVPLSTLVDRSANGSLGEYLARRRLVLEPEVEMFVLAPAAEAPTGLAASLSLLRPQEGPPGLRLVARWDDRAWPLLYPSLVLYALEPSR